MPVAPTRIITIQRSPLILPDETGGMDCVLLMPLNEGSGNPKDYSGYGHHGTLVGATWANGRYGKCCSFDGENDYVDLGSVLGFERTDSFSVVAWVKRDRVGYEECIVGKQITASPGTGWRLLMETGGKLSFATNGQVIYNRLYIKTLDTFPLTYGWEHFAATYDGSSRASGIHIFANGQEKPLEYYADNLSTSILNPASATIGARDSGSAPFDGLIDSVLILRGYVLSAGEVAALYRGGRLLPQRMMAVLR